MKKGLPVTALGRRKRAQCNCVSNRCWGRGQPQTLDPLCGVIGEWVAGMCTGVGGADELEEAVLIGVATVDEEPRDQGLWCRLPGGGRRQEGGWLAIGQLVIGHWAIRGSWLDQLGWLDTLSRGGGALSAGRKALPGT